MTALAKREPQSLAPTETLDDLFRIGEVIEASQMFKDTKTKAQAIVKMLAGRDMGIPPLASLRGIHVFEGKVEIGAGLLAAQIKRSGRYDYRVVKSTNSECVIDWLEDGIGVGQTSYTTDDARLAGLIGKQNWQKNPSDMLFARCLTRGQRRFCPDVALGSVYAEGEIERDEDDQEKPKRAAKKPVAPSNEAPQVELVAAELSTGEAVATGAGNNGQLPDLDSVTNSAIEARKAALIAEIKSLALEVYTQSAYDTWEKDAYNRTVKDLEVALEKVRTQVAARPKSAAPEPASEYAGQRADGARKVLRTDENGKPVAVFEDQKTPLQKIDDLIESWREKGQDYATIKAHAETVVGIFQSWHDLEAVEQAKVIRCLETWEPKAKEAVKK